MLHCTVSQKCQMSSYWAPPCISKRIGFILIACSFLSITELDRYNSKYKNAKGNSSVDSKEMSLNIYLC